MTNQDKFIEIFGDDAWKRMLVFNGTAEEFKEFWATSYKDKSYEDGLNDAWECAREIDTNRELEDYVFGDDLDHGFDNISVIEAMIKIKKYKEDQKCKKCGHYPENGITSNAICLKCNNDKFVEKPITTHENNMKICEDCLFNEFGCMRGYDPTDEKHCIDYEYGGIYHIDPCELECNETHYINHNFIVLKHLRERIELLEAKIKELEGEE